MIIGGSVYSLINEFMPYHADAVGMPWQQLNPGIQLLLLACINGAGGLMVIIGVLLLLILRYSFAKGELWSFIAIPVTGFTTMAHGLAAALPIDQQTPAEPPLIIFVIVASLFIMGAIASWPSIKLKRSAG